MIVDATDNAPSRYMISDCCVVLGKVIYLAYYTTLFDFPVTLTVKLDGASCVRMVRCHGFARIHIDGHACIGRRVRLVNLFFLLSGINCFGAYTCSLLYLVLLWDWKGRYAMQQKSYTFFPLKANKIQYLVVMYI